MSDAAPPPPDPEQPHPPPASEPRGGWEQPGYGTPHYGQPASSYPMPPYGGGWQQAPPEDPGATTAMVVGIVGTTARSDAAMSRRLPGQRK